MSNVSISGAISGIDTASLVNQLMTVEAQSQTTIKSRQTAAQKAADAYTNLITSLKSLATQSAALAKTSTWQGSSVTSSSASVTATTTGNAVGTITFDVTEVAKAHTLISTTATPAASTSSVIASGGTLTIRDGVGPGALTKGTIDVGSGTLAEVVAGINASDLGLRAAAVQTAPGVFRLQVTSATSGAASTFSVDGLDGMAGQNDMDVLTAGIDAKLTIGDILTTGYTVTSSSNTFANLLPGVSLTVSKKGETGVTVDAKLDGSAVATQVSSMVDATNAALTSLAALTAYDFGTKSGAALYGDSSIRSLQQQILGAVSGARAPGVQLTRDGKLSFDKDAFVKAFVADPSATAIAYGATSSFTPNTGVLGKAAMILSNASTRAGSYEVAISVNSAKEKWTIAPAVGSIDGKIMTITQGDLTANYTVGVGESLADTVAAINAAAAAAGITTTASTDGTSIFVTANEAGTASAYSVTFTDGVATKTQAGRDIIGTIDGEETTGVGNILTLNSATSRANGLSLAVDVSDADVLLNFGVIGEITYTPGLAQSLSTLLTDVTDKTTGVLARAQQNRVDDVKDFQAQIDAWDIRLATRRATLNRQFTAMETALASLKSSSSAITNLLAATSANADS
jgi:flagellar hook-associated protein 2